MKRILSIFLLSMVLAAAAAEEAKRPVSIAVLDFTTADIEGQERLLTRKDTPIRIPEQSTLNDKDRKSINSVMQGFVRMIDAWDTHRTGDANRVTQIRDNERDNRQALELYRTVVNGPTRPVILGADFLESALAGRTELFRVTDRRLVEAAMAKVAAAPGFPAEFMPRLAEAGGVHYLVSGSVADLSGETTTFEGYGIRTEYTIVRLDLTIRVTDLFKARGVYGKTYTASRRETKLPSANTIDHNLFQSLLRKAVELAAEDLAAHPELFTN